MNGNDSTVRLKTDTKRINIRYFFSRLEIQVERFQISICKTEQRFDDNLQKAYKMDNDNNTKKMWGLYTKTPHASTSHPRKDIEEPALSCPHLITLPQQASC